MLKNTPNKEKGWLFCLYFAVTWLVLAFYFCWPFIKTEFDVKVFGALANLLIKGYVPYRDGFDHKQPLVYVVNALYQLNSLLFLGFLSAFMASFSLYLRNTLREKNFSNVQANVAPLLVIGLLWAFSPLREILVSELIKAKGFETETKPLYSRFWTSLFIAWSVVIAYRRPSLGFGLGLLGALTFWMQSNSVLALVPLFLVLAYKDYQKGFHFFIKKLLVCALPACLLSALIISYFAYSGALKDLWDYSFRFNFEYLGTTITREHGYYYYFTGYDYVALLTFCFIIFLLTQKNLFKERTSFFSKGLMLLLSMMVVDVFSFFSTGRQYHHYFFIRQALLSLSVVWVWLNMKNLKHQRFLQNLSLVGFSCLVIVPWILGLTLRFVYPPQQDQSFSSFDSSSLEVSDFLSSSQADNHIAELSQLPEVSFFKGVKSSGREAWLGGLFSYPYSQVIAPRLDIHLHQFLKDLEEDKPRYLFLDTGNKILTNRLGYVTSIAKLEEDLNKNNPMMTSFLLNNERMMIMPVQFWLIYTDVLEKTYQSFLKEGFEPYFHSPERPLSVESLERRARSFEDTYSVPLWNDLFKEKFSFFVMLSQWICDHYTYKRQLVRINDNILLVLERK